MTLGERASDLGYAAGWRLVRVLPEGLARRLFDAGADYAARNGGPWQLRRNLARVLGVPPSQVPDELIRDNLRSYARYWREAFRLPSLDLAEVAAVAAEQITGAELVDAALANGTGAILALPHSGNWDMAGVFAVSRWGTFATVAERLKPESLFRRFVRYRESLGFEIFPAAGGERSPIEALSARLQENRIVCLPAERDLSGRGVAVTFFGEETRMPAGPARLAVDTGAPLFPAHCWFTKDGWRISIGEQIMLPDSSGDRSALPDSSGDGATVPDSSGDRSDRIRAITQLLVDQFAINIAAHPADWHMLQPLWLDDLSEARRARAESATGGSAEKSAAEGKNAG